MNVIKEINRINKREISLNVTEEASWHAKYKDSAYIYVGGLPFDLNEGDVIQAFSQYGEICDCNLVRDKETGKSKGFAFVQYEDQRSTVLAVDNLNGVKVVGRTIRVDHVSKYRKPKKDEEDEEEGGESDTETWDHDRFGEDRKRTRDESPAKHKQERPEGRPSKKKKDKKRREGETPEQRAARKEAKKKRREEKSKKEQEKHPGETPEQRAARKDANKKKKEEKRERKAQKKLRKQLQEGDEPKEKSTGDDNGRRVASDAAKRELDKLLNGGDSTIKNEPTPMDLSEAKSKERDTRGRDKEDDRQQTRIKREEDSYTSGTRGDKDRDRRDMDRDQEGQRGDRRDNRDNRNNRDSRDDRDSRDRDGRDTRDRRDNRDRDRTDRDRDRSDRERGDRDRDRSDRGDRSERGDTRRETK